MHQPHVLTQVIFTVECPRIDTFVFALTVVMGFAVVIFHIHRAAINTFFVTRFVGDDGPEWCANPFLERQM